MNRWLRTTGVLVLSLCASLQRNHELKWNAEKLKLPRSIVIRYILVFMIRSGLFVVALFCFVASPIVFAADNTPSEASIKQLLDVGQAHKLLDAMVAQMDAYMKQAMQQATQGQRITPEIQKDIERRRAEMMAAMKELIDWNKLEPMYVRIYQKSFTQGEIDGLIAFYKTSTGQALLTKMPVVMQNTMNELQQMMQPMMQRIGRMQQEVVAEIQAEKKQSGG